MVTTDAAEDLRRRYSELSQQLAQAKREGRDLAALKTEHKQVFDRLQELSPRKQKRARPEPAEDTVSAEIIADLGQLFALREEWDDLLQRAANPSPFVTWEWWWPWLECFGETHTACVAIARDGQGRLLAGAPFTLSKTGGPLMFMGSRGGPDPAYLTIPALPQRREEALQAMIQALTETLGTRCAGLLWEQCPVNENLGAVLSAAGREGWQATVQVKRQYLHGQLPDSWDAYIGSVASKNRRNYLRNQFDRLEREWASAEYAVQRDKSAALDTIRQLAQYNIRRRESLGDYSRWNDAVFNRCLDRVVELFADKGWLRVFTIHVQGELAAALMGWAYHGTFFAYQIGETDQHPELGLGQCVISHGIRSCIEEGLKRFEFLGEGHSWKRSYFPDQTAAATVSLGPDCSAYWTQVGFGSLRRALGRRLKEVRNGS
ncbi:MAG: GNAT family N-acetyltransferase [Armatimonadota bacterium]